MKTGLTLPALAAELERQRVARRDYLVPTADMRMISLERPLDADDVAGAVATKAKVERVSLAVLPNVDEPLRMTEMAHRHVAERAGIPAKFYDSLRGSDVEALRLLLDENVNTIHRERPKQRMIRAFHYEGQEPIMRAMLSERYRRLDNFELGEAILPVLGGIPDVSFPTSQITEERMYVTALAPRVEREVKVGDAVQAGVRISNSEVGSGSLKVEPLVYRLVCANGMVVPVGTSAGVKARHVGRVNETDDLYGILSADTLALDDRAFFAKVVDAVKAAVDETNFEMIVDQMRDAASSEKMVSAPAGIDEMARRFSINDGEKSSVLHHLIEGGDLTAYGVLNAVTRTAQDVDSYDRSMELEATGGKILAAAGGPVWRAIAGARS